MHNMAPQDTKSTSRIAIVGVGQVGGAVAYALILGSATCELLLVDVKVDLRDAQVRDLSDVAYAAGGTVRVRAATHHEAGQCDIVVITAGSKYSLGETNIQHMHRNVSVIRNVVKAMTPFRSDAIVLVVSNPVDLLTSIAQEVSGLPKSQVFGSGTFLESVRLRGLLADKTGVAVNSVQLSVLGVHGSSQVVAWSSATINGIPLHKVVPSDGFGHDQLAAECNERAESIFRTKGSTPFGIGSVVASICASISFDRGDVQPISHFQPEFGCCFSLPVVIGRRGIMKTIKIPLEAEENAAIARSAERVKNMMKLGS